MGEPPVSQQPASEPNQPAFNRLVVWVLPAYLIGNFLFRTMTAAHEYPLRTEQVLEMVIDGFAISGCSVCRSECRRGYSGRR